MLVAVTSAHAIEPAAEPLQLFRNGTPPRVRRAARAAPGPLVRRPRLLDLLPAEDGPPVVVAAAPAGYGKTTLLREWSEHDPRPFAWVTADAAGDEGIWLLAAVAAAVECGSGRRRRRAVRARARRGAPAAERCGREGARGDRPRPAGAGDPRPRDPAPAGAARRPHARTAADRRAGTARARVHAPRGVGDAARDRPSTRSRAPRHRDAAHRGLARRRVAGGALPRRAGQPDRPGALRRRRPARRGVRARRAALRPAGRVARLPPAHVRGRRPQRAAVRRPARADRFRRPSSPSCRRPACSCRWIAARSGSAATGSSPRRCAPSCAVRRPRPCRGCTGVRAAGSGRPATSTAPSAMRWRPATSVRPRSSSGARCRWRWPPGARATWSAG